jgi:NADPH-dependent curcumin reductase CurA
MPEQMHQIALASRPNAAPTAENFRLESQPMPDPGKGEVLIKVQYISLDPYMRGRMGDNKSYVAPIPVDGKMEGGGVGEVVASNSAQFEPGDFVMGMLGWATHAVLPAATLMKLDPAHGPITTALGVLGMPGFTGWHGLMEYGRPKKGETLVVAAATGPVGSMVGQLAKSLGLRAVGIAGGPEKCALAVDTFGFDACVDHRAFDTASDLRKALAAHCPDGVDIYFENVGGKVLEAVFPLLNNHARIPICGMISWYNAGGMGANAPAAGLTVPALWSAALTKFMSINGFIISNHWDRLPTFLAEVGPKVAKGDIAYLEDITDGLENAPAAFIGLLEGKNKGKQLVKIA